MKINVESIKMEDGSHVVVSEEKSPAFTRTPDSDDAIVDTTLVKYYGISCNAILGYTDLKVKFLWHTRKVNKNR